MKYQIKAYEVPKRSRPRREVATATPRSLPPYTLEASSDREVRSLIRERYRQQGRTIRSLNAASATQYIVYVEAR